MPDKKISDLTSGSAIGGTEELPIVQGSTTVKTTINAIKTFFDTIYTTTSAVTTTLLGYVKKGTLTTNYIPKATASDTIGDSQIFDDGTNVGIGTIAPTATIHGKGIDATSSNYALKVDNSASSALLYVRNDGIVSIGKTLQIQRYNYSSTKAFWIEADVTENTLMSTQNADLVFKTRSSGTVETMRMTNAGKIIINNGSYLTLGVLDPTLDKYAYIDSAGNITASAGLKFAVCNTGTTTGMIAMQIEAGGNVGICTSPTARTHIQGVDATSSNYALKIDNSASSPLLYVRNDGLINIGGLTPSQIVGTDASKNLVSIAFGTTAGTVLEGDRITQTITNGVTDKAPSEDAVFDALALKLTAANNLSDLANPLTARNNLKIWDLFLTGGNQSTTSNVATNITDLVSPTLTASKRYRIHGVIKVGCNNTGGIRFQITLPSGASMDISLSGSNTSNTAYINATITSSATLSAQVNSFNGLSMLRVDGEISLGVTAGTIQFGFASGINTQTSTVYQLGTHLTVTQIN